MAKVKRVEKKVTKKVPKFSSVEEEAKFWDTRSPLDFPGEFKPVPIKVGKPLSQKRVVSIRLDEEIIEKMEKLAKRKHIGTSTLARMLIAEGLEKAAK